MSKILFLFFLISISLEQGENIDNQPSNPSKYGNLRKPNKLTKKDKLAKADNLGLDLVEMTAKADPPVCRIMDFGKYQYQEEKRQRDAKKKQVVQKIKEIKFHLHIDDNDFKTKLNHSIEFLQRGDKVRFVLTYRGREMSHTDLGDLLIQRIIDAVGDNGIIDSPAKLLGKNCQMTIAPNTKKKKTTEQAEQTADDAKQPADDAK